MEAQQKADQFLHGIEHPATMIPVLLDRKKAREHKKKQANFKGHYGRCTILC